jgi:hypothetical protein
MEPSSGDAGVALDPPIRWKAVPRFSRCLTRRCERRRRRFRASAIATDRRRYPAVVREKGQPFGLGLSHPAAGMRELNREASPHFGRSSRPILGLGDLAGIPGL